MNRSPFFIVAIVWCVLFSVNGEAAAKARATGEVAQTIRGVVESIHPNETPPTIMMTIRVGGKEDVMIGAFLARNATIMRGNHRIALDSIHVGESVTMTYIKTRRGLAALSIVAGPN